MGKPTQNMTELATDITEAKNKYLTIVLDHNMV